MVGSEQFNGSHTGSYSTALRQLNSHTDVYSNALRGIYLSVSSSQCSVLVYLNCILYKETQYIFTRATLPTA